MSFDGEGVGEALRFGKDLWRLLKQFLGANRPGWIEQVVKLKKWPWRREVFPERVLKASERGRKALD